MKIIRPELVSTVIYLTFKQINSKFWEILLNAKIKKINICAIKNLDHDILGLQGCCATDFAEYDSIFLFVNTCDIY